MDAIDLAGWDDAAPFNPDPALWSANLTALRAEQPELARQLERTGLPSHWRPVTALDGFPTYRLEPAGAPPQWLAGTAAPRTRAGALLRYDRVADKNPAVPTIAAGAELKLLLDRLTSRQAVFVFEDDTTQLAAVLRTVDVAHAITCGRCILVPPQREQAFLAQLFEAYPGLLSPGTILTLPAVSDERLARVRTICETVARQTNDTRNRRLRSLTARIRPRPEHTLEARLAVLALGPNPSSHQLTSELAGAADKLRWSCCRCAATGPRNVHVLPHCERLADFAAELSICIDHSPGSLPLPASKTVCQWHLSTKDIPESLADDDTVHLAATPAVAQALRAAGVPGARLIDFHWAFPVRDTQAPSRPRSPRAVAVVADLPDASASACRIKQPTHKRLWAQLQQTAAKVWETAEITRPATLLRSAERASGVELSESSLRTRMVRIIEHVLIPAVVLERISQLLQQASFEVVIVGTGWHRCSSKPLQLLAESLDGLPEPAAKMSPLAAVFAGPLDPLSPALFHAAALGWPLLIHSPGALSLSPRLAGILHAQQHYDPFAGSQELRAALNAMRADPEWVERRCARVQVHLQQHHGYAQRLTSLVRRLGLDWPARAT
ncbi:MAG: hypothetical protein ACE5I3_08005 [Phycisphaerae bacterium]